MKISNHTWQGEKNQEEPNSLPRYFALNMHATDENMGHVLIDFKNFKPL